MEKTAQKAVEVEVVYVDPDKLQPEPAPQAAERDDGMRFKCSACEAYLKPDPEGSGMKCDDCEEWFPLCEKCMPDVDNYSRDAVWLCPSCRE